MKKGNKTVFAIALAGTAANLILFILKLKDHSNIPECILPLIACLFCISFVIAASKSNKG